MPNKAAQHLEKLLLAHQTVEGETPLQYLVSVYQNPRNGTPLRVEAAKAAAVYVHKKQPVAVEHSGSILPTAVRIITPLTRAYLDTVEQDN